MADTEAPVRRRGVDLPLIIDIPDEGRKFQILSLDTQELWYLYGEYEALIASMASMDPDAPPNFDRAKARQQIDLMAALCELCVDEEGKRVIFAHSFAPGEQTPRKLGLKVMEAIFADFLAESEDGSFRPLVMDLAQVLDIKTEKS